MHGRRDNDSLLHADAWVGRRTGEAEDDVEGGAHQGERVGQGGQARRPGNSSTAATHKSTWHRIRILSVPI